MTDPLDRDPAANATAPRWHDPALAPEERAAALLSEMTDEEKVSQLGSTWPGVEKLAGDVAPMQESQAAALPFDEEIRGGLGQITRAFGTVPRDPAEGAARLADLQRRVVAANRFGIPAVAHEECLTGFTAWKATVYPTALAWGAAFDPELVERMAAAIGSDMADVGVHQGLSPVLDVVRDYRWGRVEETIGEDPYLVSEVAAAYVRGLQSAGVVATLKHFAGYSASRGARNHAPVAIGARELQDVVLPPFEKAVVQAGARSVMNSYAEIDGVPPAADHELLTGLLRDRWGFTGTVVSDYWAVPFLASMHRVAGDVVEAAELALEAGLDVELPHTLGFGGALLERLRARPDGTALLDRAVLRVLVQKAELGLLDPGWDPAPGDAEPDLDSRDNRRLAAMLAEESLVLLANDGLLPLAAAPARIAVVGPVADDPACLFGCYSFPNHVVADHPGTPIGIRAMTPLEAIRAEFPDARVAHEQGVPVQGGDTGGIAAAVAAAQDAELVVLMVGDRSGLFGAGTSGEGCDAVDLALPGHQAALVDAVLGTGVPTVLVAVTGRPYAIGAASRRAAATVQAFFPGEEGGQAIAGLLSGRVAPSGRLPVQIPGDRATQPGTYLAPPLALQSDGVSSIDPSPAFPFGHGLSTTTFEVTAAADAEVVATNGRLTVTADVRNTGTRPGTHVVQLYLSDPLATVTRPVRRLVGFARVALQPGEGGVVAFDVHADVTAFTGIDRRLRVEPGEIVLTVAASAADAGTPLHVELVGGVRHVDHTRVLGVPVHVTADEREARSTEGSEAGRAG